MAPKPSSKDSKSVSKSSPSTGYSLRPITLILLPLLSIAGAFTTLVLATRNGTFDIVQDVVAQNGFFPGTRDSLLTFYTGYKPLDSHLAGLVTFFAPVVDLRNGDLTLAGIFGLGQIGAAWALMMLESLRLGNKGRIVSFVGTFGLIFQNITFAITVPIYLLIHVLTSPAAGSFPGKHASSVLLVPAVDFGILPLSVILGYIIPSVLMGLPSPSVLSPTLHQQLIALWQPFPLWSVLIQWSTKYIYTLFTAKTSKIDAKEMASLQKSYLGGAKYVYGFVLMLCMTTHIPVLAISLLPPSTFSESTPILAHLAQSDFFGVFVPYPPVLGLEFSTLAQGVQNFLVWDLYIGSTAFLLWATLLYRNAAIGSSWLKLSWNILTSTLFSGPIGAATILLWERDAIVGLKDKQRI